MLYIYTMKFSKEPFPGASSETFFPENLSQFKRLDDVPLEGERHIALFNGKKFAVAVADTSHRFDEIVPVAEYEARKEELVLKEIASEIYRMCGIAVLPSRLYSEGASLARTAMYPDVYENVLDYFRHATEEEKKKFVAEYQKGFVLDRLLENRDTYDLPHVVVDAQGKVIRTTMGLALRYINEDNTAYTESYVDLQRRNDYEHWLLIGLTEETIRTSLQDIVSKKSEILEIFSRLSDTYMQETNNQAYFQAVEQEFRRRFAYLEHMLTRDYEGGLEKDTRYTTALDYIQKVLQGNRIRTALYFAGAIDRQTYAKKLREDFVTRASEEQHDYVDEELVDHISDQTLLYLADMYDDTQGEIRNMSIVMRDAIARHIIALEESSYPFYKRLADNYGIDVATYKERLQNRIEKLVSDSDIYVAVSAKVAGYIFRDKRFKTQFEVGTSGSLNGQSARAALEHAFFGFPLDTEFEKEKRPLYGYLSDNPLGLVHGVYLEDFDGHNLSQYGGLHFKMKKEKIKQKCTVTFGDSQMSHGYSPSPLAKPHFTSFDIEYMDPLDIMSTSLQDEMLQHEYFEVQMHGGIDLSMVEALYVNKKSIEPVDLNIILDLAARTGISIHYYE